MNRTELPQQHVCKEEEVLAEQQLCNQERNSSLDQDYPGPPQIKEEQEELCTSLEGEQLVLKQEMETFMLTPTCEESHNSEDQNLDLSFDKNKSAAEKQYNIFIVSVKGSVEPEPNSEDQLLSHNSHVAESQDHKGAKHGDSGSTRNVETKPQKRRHENKSHSDNVCNPTVSKVQLDTNTELPQQHVCKEEEVLADQQRCNQERNSSLDQDDPGPPQIKEEQEELCTNLEGEQLVLKQEMETFMLTPTCEESDTDNSEDQNLDFSPDETQSAAEKESEESDTDNSEDWSPDEPKRQKRRHENKSHSVNVCNSTMSKVQLDTNTGSKKLCDTCGKDFKYIYQLNKHQLLHTGEKAYPCDFCEKRFPKPFALKEHMRVHTGEKPYPCNTCDKEFSTHGSLKKHMNVHTDKKLYPCNICEKGFSHLNSLKEHMRVHTGEKPYACNLCEKRFYVLRTLKEHMRVHTGEKQYPCDTCDKEFSHRSSLKKHMRVHTGEKPYSCSTCEKRFSQLRTLKKHMRTHTGEKP